MGILGWIGVVLAAALAFVILQFIYLSAVLKWEHEKSVGLAYYGLPPKDRAAFKRRLKLHAVLLSPVLWLSSKLSKFTFQRASFQHKGIAAPMGSCSPESFAQADQYQAKAGDIFVVTQMKCLRSRSSAARVSSRSGSSCSPFFRAGRTQSAARSR